MAAELPPPLRLAVEFRDQHDWGTKPAATNKRGFKVWRAKTALSPIDGMLLVATFDDIPASTLAAVYSWTEKMAKDPKSAIYRLDENTAMARFFGKATAPNEAAIKAAVAARGEKKFADDRKEDGFKLVQGLPPPGPEEEIWVTTGKPMMPLVKPREIENRFLPPFLLSEAQCTAAGVKPGTWGVASLPSAMLPKTSGQIRGLMPRWGMLVEPTPDGMGCTVTQVMLFNLCGSIPAVLLNSFNEEALKSFDGMEKVSRELLKENGGKAVTPQEIRTKWT